MTASEKNVDLLGWALAYGTRGWPVLPLHHPLTFGPKDGPGRAECSCRVSGCHAQGKHPRTANGLTGATTDAGVIRSWWDRWPEANIGLLTGVAFDVLDLDGIHALDALDGLAPPEAGTITTPVAITGRGVHLFFSPLGAGNRAAMAPGVDWRGVGGYVVAAPSAHHLHGDRYSWGDLDGCGIDDPLAPAPKWLADLVVRPAGPRFAPPTEAGGSRYGRTALDAEVGRVAMAPEGARNDTLVRAAYRLGQLVAGDQLDAQEVAGALLTIALRIGLSEVEAVGTIRSGLTSGMASPRRPEASR